MKVKLSEIADITTGYIKRGTKKPAEPITIPIIQLRDLSVNGTINYNYINEEEISSNDRYPQLNPGDIIFAAKGSKRSAGVIEKQLAGLTASNHYLIIRIRDEYKNKILPEYLAFYLRQKPAMDFFSLHGTGSYIPFISANALKDLQVNIPPLENQKIIKELDFLFSEEKRLSGELLDLKEKLYKNTISQIITR